jgi:hypothetical protein
MFAQSREDAQREMNFQREMFKPIIDQQIAAQQQQMRWGEEDRGYYTGTFRPVEQGLVADALAFDTDAERNRLATQAGADSGRAFSQTQQMIARAEARRGVNPNSGAGLEMQRMMGVDQAARRAAMMTGTRQQAKDKGTAMRYAAVGLGNPLAAQAQNALTGATNAGNAAAGNIAAPGTFGMNAQLQAGQVRNQGVGIGMQGLNSAASNYASIYNTNAQQQGAMWGGVGSMLGMGLGAYGAFKMNPATG